MIWALVAAGFLVLVALGTGCFWLGRVWERDSGTRPKPPGNLHTGMTINQMWENLPAHDLRRQDRI